MPGAGGTGLSSGVRPAPPSLELCAKQIISKKSKNVGFSDVCLFVF